MRVKKCATKALQSPIKVMLVKEGDIYVTHIYRSRESYRLDEFAHYKRKVFKTLDIIPSTLTVKTEKVKDS